MIKSVTITHHVTKPEYQWEFVVPEGPTVLLRQESLVGAFALLGLQGEGDHTREEIEQLPNGGSQSVNADLSEEQTRNLVGLGVKSV